MKVELINSMGSDIEVCNAARVSFAKQTSYEQTAFGWYIDERDVSLINYLAKHGHWSPFAHVFASFRIKAPIFVARQLAKHQVGLAWNEVSRRYVDDEPEFYKPDSWRLKADNVKQGSSDEIYQGSLVHPVGHTTPNSVMREAAHIYNYMVSDLGICPEQARMVLPQSMYTEWIWSGSLYAFARVCKLRLDSHAQRETQEVADQIAGHMAKLFTHSWKALMEH